MTLLEMRTKCRYFLDDDQSGATGQIQRWSDVEINSYINEAYRFYYNELVGVGYDGLLINPPASLDLVANTETVSLPADWFKTRMLYRVESDRKVPLDYVRNYDYEVDTTGYGSSFYRPAYDFRGANILLYPRPSFSEVGALLLEYWPSITEMSLDADTTATGFSTQWHSLLPLRAALWAKGGREEDDVSNLTGMLQSSEISFNETKDRMTNSRGYVEPFDTSGGSYGGY